MKKRSFLWLLTLCLLMAFSMTAYAAPADASEKVSLNGKWDFVDPDVEGTQEVTVPNSWDNFKSAGNLMANVKTCTYERKVDVSAYEGKKLALEFEGVNKTAVVSVDGEEIGKHIGGFSTFYMDITEACQGKDEVTVKVAVTNMDFNTMPVNSDFTHFGGIYRDVFLVINDAEVSISNSDYGSDGVYCHTTVDAAAKTATLSPVVMIDYSTDVEKDIVVETVVKDAEGQIVASNPQTVSIEGDATAKELKLRSINLTDVHLWNGTIDPYLYTVETNIKMNDTVVDSDVQKVGFRTYEVKGSKFYLNGEEYTLRGVGMHQEFGEKTNATTDAQKEQDMSIVLEMGANALRTCHYPHDQYFYDLCDENGIVVWSEIPFYLVMLEAPAFKDNCMQSALEMVKQGMNHPSIIIWGVQNEVNVYPQYQMFYPTQASVEQLGVFMKELVQAVTDADPSRLIGEAEIDNTAYSQETAGWTTEDSGINTVGFNIYTGWYSNVNGATPANKVDRIVDAINRKVASYKATFDEGSNSSTNYVLTEYGAGANIEQHADLGEEFLWGGSDASKGYTTSGNFHPEEYQSYVHEGMYMALYGDKTNNIEANKDLWATFAWSLFDFSCYRNEGGTTRRNTKGLVASNREDKKDAFYLYKANWTEDPFTYITSKRYTDRPESKIGVKVYSNCDDVTLIVNGKDYGKGTLEQDNVFVWDDVELAPNGKQNVVEAIGTKDGKEYKDTCNTWKALRKDTVTEKISLNGKWDFVDPDVAGTQEVDVPNSWDNFKSAGYLMLNVKTCTYERKVDVSKYAGSKIALEFEGVNKIAEVYVDGEKVGSHTGGFSTFYIDITDACAGKDEITVKVDVTNMNFDTMPVNSDFTHFGGIYRDVYLVVDDPEVSISNSDCGSDGVYVHNTVDAASKTVTISPEVMLDYNMDEEKEININVDVKDAEGNVVASGTKAITATGSAIAEKVAVDDITLENAHLWNGTIDPYLYTVETSIKVDGAKVDSDVQKVGFRTYEVKSGKFYLNGEEYQLRGVGMHQEIGEKTNATTAAQREADINTVLEMGANALRTCHYPHNQQTYDLCDEKGIVVWSEIPFYLVMLNTDEFKDNCMQSALEMVKQGMNHPSIIVWGIQNEVNYYASYAPFYPTQASSEELSAFMKELAKAVSDVDPSRLIGEAEIDNTAYSQETAGWTTEDSGINTVGFNVYTGWYSNVNGATPENKVDRIVNTIARKIETYKERFDGPSNGTTNYVLTEYGAGANTKQHADMDKDFIWGGSNGSTGYLTNGNFHPEEYQAYVHEGMYMALYGDKTNNVEANKELWAAFAWSLFDFSCYRNEGDTTRRNTKGLIESNREVKKDAFYLYKANWTEDPFTHITSKRYTDRPDTNIKVKVYSNCDSVRLVVNGKDYGEGKLEQDSVFVWDDVALNPANADNTVEAIGTKDGEEYTDTCDDWKTAAGEISIEAEDEVSVELAAEGDAVEAPAYAIKDGDKDRTEEIEAAGAVEAKWYATDENGEKVEIEAPTTAGEYTYVVTVSANTGDTWTEATKEIKVTVTVKEPEVEPEPPVDPEPEPPVDPEPKPPVDPEPKPPVDPEPKPPVDPQPKPPVEPVKPVDTAKAKLTMDSKLKGTQTGSTLNITWGKVAEADGYTLYGNYCGKDCVVQKEINTNDITSVKLSTINGKKINLAKEYKMYIISYRMVNGKRENIAKSLPIHVAGRKHRSRTNAKAIRVNKSKFTLKVKKSTKMKIKVTKMSGKKKFVGHVSQVRCVSGNPAIATVTKTGKIVGKSKGTCTIYIHAENGLTKTVKVVVK